MMAEVDDGRMHAELWLSSSVLSEILDEIPDGPRGEIREWILDAYSLGFSHGRAVQATENREDFELFLARRNQQ